MNEAFIGDQDTSVWEIAGSDIPMNGRGQTASTDDT